MVRRFRVPGRLPAKCQQVGVSLAAALREAGLPRTLFDQPRVLLNTDEFFALWNGIGKLSADPAIGILLGTERRPEHFDPIALAALSTRNFGDAMRQVARHKQLSCPEEIVHEHTQDEWRIHFRWLRARSNEPDILTDLCFAWVLSIGRLGTGVSLSPLRLELMRPAANAKLFERHFGCPVQFRTVRNAIVFHASDADAPFVTQNAELLAMLAPQLDEELHHLKTEESFRDQVRAVIQQKLAGRRPKIEEIASGMHLSPRTLQRRLQDEGSSFQQTLEDARRSLARHYLAQSMLELNEAAYLLGYEDVNSFVRAFRIWEGVPPARWREAQVCHAG